MQVVPYHATGTITRTKKQVQYQKQQRQPRHIAELRFSTT